MVRDEGRPDSEDAVAGPAEKIRVWWASVLAGQVDASHPVHGTKLRTRLDGDTLVISGTVPTEADRDEIEAETEHLKGHGIASVRNELTVVPEVTDEPDLLTQTLIGVFESGERAGVAQGYLEGHVHVRQQLLKLVTPDASASERDALHALLPEAFWKDVDNALDEGRALLVVTVDETEAFKARELLDEETRSLQTLVLPPEAARPTAAGPQATREPPSAPAADESIESARRQTLRREEDVHGR